MLTISLAPKQCAVCPKEFMPRSSFARVCSQRCAMKLVKADKVKERETFKQRKEAAKRLPDLIAEAQVAFNAFIRARDAGLPCICCGKPFEPQRPGGSMDAGHFRSRGAAPGLRFNEDNCFGQRKNCNRPGGATYAAFRAGVVARIGLARVQALEADNAVRKFGREELIAIKTTYRQKLRDLQRATPITETA